MKKSFCFCAATILLHFFTGYSMRAADTTVYKTKQLTEKIFELTADGGGYPVKVIVSVGDDGILIVDSGERENGERLVEALKAFNKGMPKVIINTHSHIEHIGGNIAIEKGPVIIGHRNLRDRYVNGLYVFNEFPESALPNLTFTDSMSLFFNGEEIKLIAFPGAHDNSDIIVWFTGSRIVCTAALCNGKHFPSIDGELGDVLKYPETVARVIARLPEDVILIPGHGDDCSIKEFRSFHDMLTKTSGIIQEELAKGKDLQKIQNGNALADWASWELYVDRNAWIEYWVKGFKNPKKEDLRTKIYAPIYHAVAQSRGDVAAALYRDLKKNHSDQYYFDERTALYIGRRLAYTNKNDDAIKFLNICLEEYPGTEAESIAYYTLGNVYWKKGNKAKAKEYYKLYLKKYPGDETALERIRE